MKDPLDCIVVPGEDEDADIETVTRKWAKKLEKELYEAYHNRETNQPTGKYSDVLRRLYTGLRHPKNRDLCHKVINQQIPLHQLVRMSEKELINRGQKLQRDQAIQESMLKATMELPRISNIRKTHKGDLIREDEDGSNDHETQPTVDEDVNLGAMAYDGDGGATSYGAGGTRYDPTITTAYGSGTSYGMRSAYGNGTAYGGRGAGNDTSYGGYSGTAYGGDGMDTSYGGGTSYSAMTAYGGGGGATSYGDITRFGGIPVGEIIFQGQLDFQGVAKFQIKAKCVNTNIPAPRREALLIKLDDYTSDLVIDKRVTAVDATKYIQELSKRYGFITLEVRPSNKEKKQTRGFYRSFDVTRGQKKFGVVQFNKEDLKEVKSVFMFPVKDELPEFMQKYFQHETVTIHPNPEMRNRKLFLLYAIKPMQRP